MESSDQIMKIVGRKVQSEKPFQGTPLTREEVRKWRETFPTPMPKKGVYRFKTHKEADEWLLNQMTPNDS